MKKILNGKIKERKLKKMIIKQKPFGKVTVKGNSFIFIVEEEDREYNYNKELYISYFRDIGLNNINKLHLIVNFTLSGKEDRKTLEKAIGLIYIILENRININKIILNYTGCDNRYVKSLIRDPQYDNIIRFGYFWNGLYRILKGYHVYTGNDGISVKLQLNKFDKLRFALFDEKEYQIYSRADNLYITINSRKQLK